MRFFWLFILVFISIAPVLQAQVDSSKLSEQYYRDGMDAFKFAHRKQALDLFRKAVAANPKNAKAHLMAGKSIMLTIHKEQSLPYFKKAYLLDAKIEEDILFLIGQAYHYNEQFDSALWYYEKFNTVLSQSLKYGRMMKMNEVNWKIFECRNAKVYKAHPVQVEIIDLDENINSEWPDYAPTITADESMMIYTTRRPESNSNATLAEDMEYYEEIFMSKKVDGKWQKAIRVEELNSDFHDASVSLSPDGKEMFVYSDDNNGDIYETDLQADGTWSSPKRLNGFINSPYMENSAVITSDYQKLFFVSDRPDGYGGTDIYMSEKNKRGEWGPAVNLGPVINTERDEEDAFVTNNGQHLYFSSNGHAGMGDLDIYRATFDSATMQWTEPLNLGYPVNSVENDIYFVLTGDEKYAYISSLRGKSQGEQDIYRIDLTNWKPLSREKLVEAELENIHNEVKATLPVVANPVIRNTSAQPVRVAVVEKKMLATQWQFQLKEETTENPLDGVVTLTNLGDNTELKLEKIDVGHYACQLQQATAGKFKLLIVSPGYQSYTSVFQLSEINSGSFEQTIFLKRADATVASPSAAGSTVSLFYESNRVVPQNQYLLDMVISSLRQNKDYRITIAGHTDANGDAAYNQQLSRQRAEEAKAYIVSAGISPARIEVIAYGEDKPMANNEFSSGRKFNRRTEIIIRQR